MVASYQGPWALHRARIAGGSTVNLVEGDWIRHVVVSDDHVYFTQEDPPRLARILKADIPESLPKCPDSAPDCYSLPEPGMETGTRAELAPEAIEVLDDSGAMFGLAYAGNAVYYANESARTLLRRDEDGTSEVVMHGDVAEVVVANGDYLYWAETATGFIMRVPLAGGTPRAVLSISGFALTDLAVSGNYIFVATRRGFVRALLP